MAFEPNPNLPPKPTGIPPEGYALLDVIADTESADAYNVIYGGRRFENFSSHPNVHVRIKSGPNKGDTSTAAGKYQFLNRTWQEAKNALNLPDFSPESQDKAAWWLAQRDYKDATGRDLLTDLRTGDPKRMAKVARTLAGTWTSLPGGIEATTNKNRFLTAYSEALGKQLGHPVPPLDIPDEPGRRLAWGLRNDIPLPRSRPSQATLTPPRPLSLPGDLQPGPGRPAWGMGAPTPPPTAMPDFGIVDGVRSPTLFEQPNGSQVVGIPQELDRRDWDERRVDPKVPAMDVGGFGSLLDPRLSPGTPNPTPRPPTNFVRPSGPAGGLPAAPFPLQAVRPEGPVGGLPAAPRGTTVTGRPEVPGSLPAAPRNPTALPLDPRLSIPPGSLPMGQPRPVPRTQFGGEGMPDSSAGGGRPVTLPANLVDLMEHNNPPLPRPRPSATSSSPVGSGAPISLTPFTAPPSPVPRAVEPAAVPEWITVTRQVPNPARSAIRPVPLEQTIRVENGIPVGLAPRITAPPPSIPEMITITERIRNPAFRAPIPLPALARPSGPVPARQSFALAGQRAMTPPTRRPAPPSMEARADALRALPVSERTIVTGESAAFQPRSVQESTRWLTGY